MEWRRTKKRLLGVCFCLVWFLQHCVLQPTVANSFLWFRLNKLRCSFNATWYYMAAKKGSFYVRRYKTIPKYGLTVKSQLQNSEYCILPWLLNTGAGERALRISEELQYAGKNGTLWMERQGILVWNNREMNLFIFLLFVTFLKNHRCTRFSRLTPQRHTHKTQCKEITDCY